SSWYQKNWGRLFKLREDQNQKTRFDNDRTGFRLASSTGGVGTGEGGDFIVADDPHNVVDSESDAEREAVLHWWDQSMSTRGNDPKTVCHVVVMQRLHERDLSGHLLAQGGYEHLCLPMEFESERRCVTSLGWQDPRTAEGDLLCQKRFGQAEVEELKRRLGTYGAAGQLQQRPAPKGGGMFRREWFQVVTHLPPECRKAVRYWDNGSTDGSGDYTVGVLMTEHKGVYFVVDVVRGQWSTGARREKQGRTAAEDGLRFPEYRVYVEQEPGSAGKDSIDDTIKYLAGYAVYGDRVTGDKITRAEPVAAQAEAGNIKLLVGPWNEPLLRELEVFPFGANDDQCDSLSGCFAKIVKKREFIFSME
ncbi:MAG: phage terminase large subunit, partial [Planctomycetia bacterium]|nr:phage terminase large subunit [Planctomycetia bacterium]